MVEIDTQKLKLHNNKRIESFKLQYNAIGYILEPWNLLRIAKFCTCKCIL